EAPEVVLDREHLATGEAGMRCVAPDGVRADHGPCARGALADHPDRQAVEDTEAVEEALDLAGGRGERGFRAFVADEHETAVGEEASRSTQYLDGVRHVVQRLEDRYEVVSAG